MFEGINNMTKALTIHDGNSAVLIILDVAGFI